MSAEGVFCVSRGVFDHPLFEREPYSRRDAWVWLVGNAAWKQSRMRVDGRMVTVERGQLMHSLRFLATKWRWSKTTVARFLDELEAENMIVISRDNVGTQTGTVTGHQAGHRTGHITICNYEDYQFGGDGKRDSDDAKNGTTTSQKRDKEEEEKKRKKEIVPADAGLEPAFSATTTSPPGEPSKGGRGEYAFEGDVIRLTSRDFAKWTAAYPKLNLRAELAARDAWLAGPDAKDRDRERWFISTAAHLRNQNAKATKGEQFKWASGIEGVY